MPSEGPEEVRSPCPVVDTHHHLWDLDRFRLPWLAGVPELDRSFRMGDYLRAAQGTGIVRTVYMEVDLAQEQHPDEAAYVFDLCRRDDNPLAGAVLSGRPDAPGFAGYLDGIASPYLKGIRRILHGRETPARYCLREEFVRGVRLLGDRGLSFDLCIRPAELGDAELLVRACPDTRFVLDHCGNPDVAGFGEQERTAWREAISRLAELPNLVCKLSGIIASAPRDWTPEHLRPYVSHCLAAFGVERAFFGGDWPVCTLRAGLREWVEALRALTAELSPVQQRMLFHDNAVRFYRLDPCP